MHVNDKYFFIGTYKVEANCEGNDWIDDQLFNSTNYFNDEAFAQQVALHQLLYRKLLKFAYDNECEDTAPWDGGTEHWGIIFDINAGKFGVTWYMSDKVERVFFKAQRDAERAIKEVVEPFMKEHPDFVW